MTAIDLRGGGSAGVLVPRALTPTRDGAPTQIVLRDGFDAKVTYDHGTEAVELPTAAWRLARERFRSG